jgi:hypothetical protein
MNKTPAEFIGYYGKPIDHASEVINNVSSCVPIPCHSAQSFWVGVMIGLLIAVVMGLCGYMIYKVATRRIVRELIVNEDI